MQSCCTQSVMNYGCSALKRDEVTSKFPRLLMEVFAVLQEKKNSKKKKKNIKKEKKVLEMYRLSLIFWLTTCMFY